MKKIICLVLSAIILFSLCACKQATSNKLSNTSTAQDNKPCSWLSLAEAKAIAEDVYNREMQIFMVIHTGEGVQVDKTQYIPNEPEYLLVTDQRFKSIDDIKALILTAYTPKYADKYYGDDYFSMPSCSYKVYNGQLYNNGGARANLYVPFFDTVQIVSQDNDNLVVEFGEGDDVANTIEYYRTYYLKKSDGIWRLDDTTTEFKDD